jgi:hypothetical protein
MKYIISENGAAVFLNQYFIGFFVENIYIDTEKKYYYRVLARFLKPVSLNANDLFYSKVVFDSFETEKEAVKSIEDIFKNQLIKEI